MSTAGSFVDSAHRRVPEMIALALLAMIVAPLVGVLLMELGSPALNFGGVGHPNGATVASAIFSLVLVLTSVVAYWVVAGKLASGAVPAGPVYSRASFTRLAYLVIAFNLSVLAFIVFVAGAWRVLVGQIERGEFRSSLGSLGVAAFLARDFLAPMACAAVAFVYRRCAPGRAETALLLIAIVATSAGSAAWGYKSSAVFALLPAFVLLVPRVRVVSAIGLLGGAIVVVIGAAMFFEQRSLTEASLFVLTRATIGAGDAAWKLWDMRDQGAFPDWAPTLLSGLGGRLASVLGAWGRSGTGWYATDFSAVASWVVKDFNPTLEADLSNVTSTAFGEGVFALGSRGYLVFAVGGGLVLAGIRIALGFAERQNRPVLAVVAANYFGFSYLAWIYSGGVVALLNVPHVISMFLGVVLILALLTLAGIVPARFRRRLPTAARAAVTA